VARLYQKKLSMSKRSPDATRWEVAGRNKRFAVRGSRRGECIFWQHYFRQHLSATPLSKLGRSRI
jgi:hypothetical protein